MNDRAPLEGVQQTSPQDQSILPPRWCVEFSMSTRGPVFRVLNSMNRSADPRTGESCVTYPPMVESIRFESTVPGR